ncbi:XRE family transcriptional regulator [Nocardia sp. NBC_00508]|uniref:helix-turn-helix domain-containing protein n=1 Tax=Nocardia sp. NBC_00508 TaxID=2975992 RepID=UPI002E815A8E|nr:XRE family transcriptional regulator [Nocardia sp. NBC_00508]WUD67352.1 XRE family transcriptional regulator [Nocardia sp. NBC_00508]
MDAVVEGVSGGLRHLRRARNMTLAALAERTGLTDGYLSNVENGVTAPSLSTLATLATVLGADMSAFFPPTRHSTVHVHRAHGGKHAWVNSSSAETHTILSARSIDPSFTGLLSRISPSESATGYARFGERLLVVLEGEIEMQIGARNFRLAPGETLHYSAHPQHLLKVTSTEPAVILWIVTPSVL